MLDTAMIDQLKTVFGKLENPVGLVYAQSDNEKQGELVEMLEQVASTSDHLTAVASDEKSDWPKFHLTYKGEPNGVVFSGIPGGHEFTSLILGILNSDQKGKLPDEGMMARIRRIKGPIRLRTFISLSCENCPDVVQALNIMAINHPDFIHEMVDGAFAQDEISEMGIQGVPSVIHDGELLSSGKSSLIELIEKLEEKFDTEQAGEAVELGEYDVIVIGAGPAGASSAIYTARKGMKTAIIAEKMGGQVQDTKGIENFISIPYTEGPQLSAQLAKHLSDYDIPVLEHRRVKAVKGEGMKTLELDSGEVVKTKALVVASGAKWRELGVPGEKEYLGRGVAFCPHCDGPFYKGKDIAVIGGGNSGVEAAIDLAGIVKSVTVIEFSAELKADQVLIDKMNSLDNISVVKNARTTQVLGNDEKVVGLEYEDRESEERHQVELDGVFVQIGLIPNSAFIKDTVETNDWGEIVVDDKCRTNVKGIYAAGDVTTVPFKQIVIAMGEGAKAGLTVFEDQML